MPRPTPKCKIKESQEILIKETITEKKTIVKMKTIHRRARKGYRAGKPKQKKSRTFIQLSLSSIKQYLDDH